MPTTVELPAARCLPKPPGDAAAFTLSVGIAVKTKLLDIGPNSTGVGKRGGEGVGRGGVTRSKVTEREIPELKLAGKPNGRPLTRTRTPGLAPRLGR